MQKQYGDRNRGTFFREEKKRTANSPDYAGSLDVNGVPHRLVGWIKESKRTAGKKFPSLLIEPKSEQGAKAKHDFKDNIGF